MNAVARLDMETGELVVNDPVALEVGCLFLQAHNSHVETVHFLVTAGKKLAEKKASLGHGEWLPWVDKNKEALGFGERTARRLIAGADQYRTLASDLNPKEALAFNRKI